MVSKHSKALAARRTVIKMQYSLKIISIMMFCALVVEEVIAGGCAGIGWDVSWAKHKNKREITNVHNYAPSFKLRFNCDLESYDKDGDGTLNINEFAKAGKTKSGDKGLKTFFILIDSNEDGQLSIDEQLHALPEHCRKGEIAAIKEQINQAKKEKNVL